MSRKKIIVAGEVFSTNLGDYAIFDSLSTILKTQGIDVIPLDLSLRKGWSSSAEIEPHDKKNWKRILPKQIKYNSFFQYLVSRTSWHFSIKNKSEKYWEKLISEADGIIIGGGQLLTESSASFYLKLDILLKVIQHNKKPLSIIGCGVGSNINTNNLAIYKKILTEAKYISLRDYGSLRKVNSYFDSEFKIDVYPDLAFALEHHVSASNFNKKGAVCGFNVMPLSVFKKHAPSLGDISEIDYLVFWKKLARGAVDSGMQVVIMTNGALSDDRQARVVFQTIKDEGINVVLFDRPREPADLYRQIEKVDYLVAMRMHAGIVGQAFGRSVATIIWDDKIPDVWEVVGGKEVTLDCNILKDNHPWEKILLSFEKSKSVYKERTDIIKKINSAVSECLKALF